tara:strand:+ start:249 stop:524 length:276 start_codon:yes stop_codon:yes gene_type:complete
VISNYPAAKIINDTNVHTGRFGKVVALQDSVITIGKLFDSVPSVDDITDFDSILPGYFGDHRSVQLKAGAEFFGPFSVVVLDSGTVIVYRL